MKKREGFVSNSSSSSFIIRKAVLTKEQYKEVIDILENGEYATDYEEDDRFIYGDAEAHNPTWKSCCATQLTELMIEKYNFNNNDFDIKYEDYPSLEGEENESKKRFRVE